MKIYNSDYKKTFFYEDLKGNNIVVATLNNNSSLIEYLENLIFDLIEKRHLNEKKIVFLVDNLWISQFLADLLIIRKVIDDKYIISNTTNFISIIDINNDFKFLMSESSIDISNKRGDILILIDFDVLMYDFHKQISELRGYYENSLWIGVCVKSSEKERIRYLSLGNKNDEINYLPESPETFKGFVNEYVLKGVEEVLDALFNNYYKIEFSKQLHGEIFNSEEDNQIELQIGTSDYFEHFDFDELDEEHRVGHEYLGNDAKSFCVTISISKYSFELSIALLGYNWDGDKFLNYEFNFEDDIYEKGDIREMEDLVQCACDRIKCGNVYIDLS